MKWNGNGRLRWEDLTPAQRGGLSVMMLAQLSLLTIGLIDLARRPSNRVRGRKLAWLPVLFVNFVGPIAYLAFGRRR